MNRILGALRGAANPNHGGHARPGAGHTPGARPGGARSGGIAGIVTSLLRSRGRR